MAITGTMQITGPVVGLVTLTLVANSPTPTDAATYNDVITIADKKRADPSPVEAELQFLDAWIVNNPNYPSAPGTLENTQVVAEISSIDLGEVVR